MHRPQGQVKTLIHAEKKEENLRWSAFTLAPDANAGVSVPMDCFGLSRTDVKKVKALTKYVFMQLPYFEIF